MLFTQKTNCQVAKLEDGANDSGCKEHVLPYHGDAGVVESFEINRIVGFDLDLVFCSATRTVKDWDTFDILSFSVTSFPPGGSQRGGHT